MWDEKNTGSTCRRQIELYAAAATGRYKFLSWPRAAARQQGYLYQETKAS
jgi:hypothetical protein